VLTYAIGRKIDAVANPGVIHRGIGKVSSDHASRDVHDIVNRATAIRVAAKIPGQHPQTLLFEEKRLRNASVNP
jgi:hypothetical protein